MPPYGGGAKLLPKPHLFSGGVCFCKNYYHLPHFYVKIYYIDTEYKPKGVLHMSDVSQETMMFKRQPEKLDVAETIKEVYAALEAKGYNPVDQLAGYLLSGDPTYITSYDNARTKLRRHERYELIEAMVISYLKQIKK